MKSIFKYIALSAFLALPANTYAQSPSGSSDKAVSEDSIIIFHSPRPLIDDKSLQSNNLLNSWGFTGLFNDYGFGLGLFYRRQIDEDLSAIFNFDVGTAKGPNELGLYSEIKIHRIYVIPAMLNANYRVLRAALGDGFRPYITAGLGPVLVMSNNAQEDFFSAFGSSEISTTFGGNIGFGAYFGNDNKSTFGAAFRYYMIPYAKGIESTQGVFVTNFSGPTLSVSYGFNF